MADTLFDVIREVGRIVGGSRTNLATGGSTTTVADTKRGEPDDTFNDGTALILTSTDAAAPQKEARRISDFAQSGGIATVDTAFSASVEAGDRYMFIPAKYPLDWMIDKINSVLTRERIVAIDDTSLDIVAEQTEYALPTGYDRSNLRQVWVETNDDANKPEWMRMQNWHVEYNGSTHLLILDTRIETSIDNRLNGNDIKLIACPYHGQVYSMTDEIDDLIHLDRIAWPTLEEIVNDELARNTGDKYIQHRFNRTAAMVEEIRRKHPIFLPEWHEKGSGW
jgi:hypothetical protein